MSLKTWICGVLKCNSVNFQQKEALNRQIEGLNEEIQDCRDECGFLKDTLISRDKEEEMEKFWNNKRDKVEHFKWSVHETDGNYQIDVRNFLSPNDESLPEIKGESQDEIAFNCLKWVIEHIKYVPDEKNYGFAEYWAKVWQTMRRKSGDCEDGNNLLHSLMLKNNVPYWRCRGNNGPVNGGFHSYLTYCRETDNQFVTLDWCFKPNLLPIAERKLHKDEQDYYGVTGSWNLKYCFGEMPTMSSKCQKK